LDISGGARLRRAQFSCYLPLVARHFSLIAKHRPKLYFKHMGRTFHFDCPHCRYEARVSGGTEKGLNCAVQTILCLDCHQLYDVFTRLRQLADKNEPDDKNEPADKDKPSPAKSRPKPTRSLLLKVINIPPLRLVENVWSVFSPKKSRPQGPTRQWRWEDMKPACPVAGSHRVKIWNAPGRCPRCGNFLEKTAFPYRWWD
jgi:transcription elongation factor Elf1